MGIVAVVAIGLALAFVFLPPPNVEATIPLSYNYSAGEEMTYNLTVGASTAVGQNSSISETFSMEILSFDGENYTVNQTVTLSMNGSPMSFSVTEKVNKTGYITYLNGTAGLQQTYSMFSGMGSFHQKDEAKVGETWHVPINWGNSSLGFNGNMTIKFGEVQNITVPAGVYRVFRMDISGDNFTMVINTPANMSLLETLSFSGQMYLEYGTCRLVDSDFQESVSMIQGAQTSTQDMSMQMRLVRHIRY